MATQREWVIRGSIDEACRDLGDSLAISPLAARILLNRGVGPGPAARSHVRPQLTELFEPDCFREMSAATARICAAIERREPILLFGDYDVDGVTGTALLARFLRLAGADCRTRLPHRLHDGYGLRAPIVEEAARTGARVIVAIDNGTSSIEAASCARRHGIDLVIADHHEPPEGGVSGPVLPERCALLNPKVQGETYPFRDLCGCAIAFKLAWALAMRMSPGKRVTSEFRTFLLDALALVAIATVADVVPLVGENRVLVTYGLRALEASGNFGLRALCDLAEVAAPLASDAIAFKLAPRINAAGRMGHADLALELLTCDDPTKARDLARRLEEENRRRRALDRATLQAAAGDSAQSLERTGGRAIILSSASWHPGVIGIVAGRLADRFHRPVLLIAFDGARGVGSARSVPGVALHRALSACDDLLVRHGGHALAAGFEIERSRLEAFIDRFTLVLAEGREGVGAPGSSSPPLLVDVEVDLERVTPGLVRELEALGPFGEGHEAPILAVRGAALLAPPREVGRDREHVQLSIGQGRACFKAIGYGFASELREVSCHAGQRIDVAFRPFRSRFRGEERIELEVVAVMQSRRGGAPSDGYHN